MKQLNLNAIQKVSGGFTFNVKMLSNNHVMMSNPATTNLGPCANEVSELVIFALKQVQSNIFVNITKNTNASDSHSYAGCSYIITSSN